ncbi:MAG: twitching motility protein PilT [Acidimicrobiaceae bacterium]
MTALEETPAGFVRDPEAAADATGATEVPGAPRTDGLAQLLGHMVEAHGSDLFVKAGSSPRLRVNGRLQPTPFASPDPSQVDRLVQSLLPASKADELAANGEADFAIGVPSLGRFRVHAYRQRGSLAVVFRRVLPGIPTWQQLGLPPVDERLTAEGPGLVLVTGPAGSGKTTTLNALIDRVNSTRAAHIVTIEDPIEFLHADKQSLVSQREVGSDTGQLTEGLRRAIRQGPDVLVASELPDLSALQAALDAASTGALVFATMGTTSAADTVSRIVEYFPEGQKRQARRQLAVVLRAIVSQRLVERADGKGRIAAVEVLTSTPKVAECIEGPEHLYDLGRLIVDGRYHGMQTFDQSLFALARDGLVSVRDALAAADEPEDLRIELQQAGLVAPY